MNESWWLTLHGKPVHTFHLSYLLQCTLNKHMTVHLYGASTKAHFRFSFYGIPIKAHTMLDTHTPPTHTHTLLSVWVITHAHLIMPSTIIHPRHIKAIPTATTNSLLHLGSLTSKKKFFTLLRRHVYYSKKNDTCMCC